MTLLRRILEQQQSRFTCWSCHNRWVPPGWKMCHACQENLRRAQQPHIFLRTAKGGGEGRRND